MKQRRLTMGSMFTGMGGWEMSAKRSLKHAKKTKHFSKGVVHRFMCDWNKHCRGFLLQIFTVDQQHVYSDVWTLRVDDLPRVDFFGFSPSCVSYSVNGKGEGEQHNEGQVVWVALSYVAKKKPVMWAMEQVPQFKKFPIWGKVTRSLRRMNYYEWQEGCLSGNDHGGIPQTRSRLFVWGILRVVSTGLVVPAPLGACLDLKDLFGFDDGGCTDSLPTDNTGLPNLITFF